MKILFFSCILFFSYCRAAVAQHDSTAKPIQTSTIKVFLNGGLNFPYTEVPDPLIRPLFGISADFTLLPDLDLNLELNAGSMEAGTAGEMNVLGFTNNYIDVIATGRLRPFAIMKNPSGNKGLKILSGIFAGTGIGFISYQANPNPMPASPAWNPLDSTRRLDFYFPLEGGIILPVLSLKYDRHVFIQALYRVPFCFSDKLDGYDPLSEQNRKKDAFNSLRFGIGLDF